MGVLRATHDVGEADIRGALANSAQALHGVLEDCGVHILRSPNLRNILSTKLLGCYCRNCLESLIQCLFHDDLSTNVKTRSQGANDDKSQSRNGERSHILCEKLQ